jgi:N,N'-diacetyllegionaminate synthase
MLIKNKVFIIAEAGVNHNGKLSNALKLVKLAKNCGADAIKFQTWNTDEIIVPNTNRPKYQQKDRKKFDQYDFAKSLELSHKDFLVLFRYCKKIGIKFLSTADDIKSVKFLKNFQNFFKIGSADLNNYQIINEIIKLKKSIILSTGLSNLIEIYDVIKFLRKKKFNYKKKLTLLHCNSAYPTPFEDVNLKVIPELKKKFGVTVGLSDHSISDECAIGAVALGANVIEKHITLDKQMAGPDHSTSLNGEEFKKMVKKIRNVEIALGSKKKFITKSALINKKLMMRSIVANKKINKGDKFTNSNICSKRPKGGIDPKFFFKLLNKKSKRVYEINDKIKSSELI